jgi:hypothetical protein
MCCYPMHNDASRHWTWLASKLRFLKSVQQCELPKVAFIYFILWWRSSIRPQRQERIVKFQFQVTTFGLNPLKQKKKYIKYVGCVQNYLDILLYFNIWKTMNHRIPDSLLFNCFFWWLSWVFIEIPSQRSYSHVRTVVKIRGTVLRKVNLIIHFNILEEICPERQILIQINVS